MIRSFFLACALSTFGQPVFAHPHVFVDAAGGFVFDDAGQLIGVRVFWLYDAYTTLFLYETHDLDQDGDGQLSAADLEKVRRGETVWDIGYEGDTYLWIDDQKQALSRPLKTSAEVVAGRIGVTFELHLQTPLNMAGRQASLKLYDPGYYYAYSVPGKAQLFGNAAGCDAVVNRFDPDEQQRVLQQELSNLSPDEVPEDINIGAIFAEEISLRCE